MFTIVRIVNHKSFHILCAKLIYIFFIKTNDNYFIIWNLLQAYNKL